MSAEEVAREHYRARRRLVDRAADQARELWNRVTPDNLSGSWARILPQLLTGVAGAQLAAARTADDYADEALDQQDVDPGPVAGVQPNALVGVASDGRPLDSLLLNAVITTKMGIAGGATLDRAMAAGYANLDMLVRTQVADAGRVADQLAIVARPEVTGYVRMVVGKTCSRCVVLAGRWYRWDAGFDRHPSCDCVGVAANEAVDEITTNPRQFFDGLSKAEQDKAFTLAGAQAIRDGADIGQVVNARRGALGLSTAGGRITAAEARALRGGRERGRLETQDVFGQQLFTTTEGITVRGRGGVALGARADGVRRPGDRYRSARAPRLMPESIYKIAGDDRDEALRLLRRNGYLTDAVSARRTIAPPEMVAPRVVTARPTAPARPAAPPRPIAPTFDQRAASAASGSGALDAATFGLDRQIRADLPEGFTMQMADALGSYGSSGFGPLNRQLRGIETLTGLRAKDAAKDLAGLDALMAASKVGTDVITFRGLRDATPMFGDRLGGDLTGTVWREDAFISTTADQGQTKFFIGAARPDQTRVLMRILSPAGTPAVQISDASVEAELLLNRGLRLRVVADRGVDPNGVRQLDVEVLP